MDEFLSRVTDDIFEENDLMHEMFYGRGASFTIIFTKKRWKIVCLNFDWAGVTMVILVLRVDSSESI